ncbi:hypothetical protein GGR50DRAFT_693345 [Xylaria sp. CBS 124048]|nr:hypothetical protein GGR50DRAFT_693345 [Xylaria sp. CBS 124048]
MKALSGILRSWSDCILQCCRPAAAILHEKPLDHDFLDNTFTLIQDEPSAVRPPSMQPSKSNRQLAKEERAPKKRRASGWTGFSVRRRLLSNNTSSPCRPQISPPTNFRHVHSYSDSIHLTGSTSSQSGLHRTSFRPLELNITSSDTQLSPLLPQFNFSHSPITPPPRAYTGSRLNDNYSPGITHARSHSSMSFNIPRRPVNDGSVFDSLRSNANTPQRPPLTRTGDPIPPSPPAVEDLVEKVAHAILERDRIQEQLDDIIERQTIYANSRPSTAHGRLQTEPVPEVPAIPPHALSFSERVNMDCPPSRPLRSPARTQYEANSSRKIQGRTPPPPLPLRLRPPLRKKKSFSRVSNWLFPPGAEHERESSLATPTNDPRPVADGDGFYQVATPEEHLHSGFDSESTVSDWTVEDEQTIPTSLSPSSAASPGSMTRPPRGVRFGWREPILPTRRDNGAVAF